MTMISVTIQANSPEEFRTVLLGLLNMQPGAKGPVAEDTAAPKTTTTNGVAKTTAKAAAAPKADKPKDEPPAQQSNGAAETPATEAKSEAPAEQPKAEAKKAGGKKAEQKEEPAGNAPELPENIKNTNSMRDLLTYLAEHGVDSADAMVAACTVLKKEVPILSKVPNVEERVRRALDVLALFPAAEGDAAQA